MKNSKNGKYKEDFDSMIRQITDADSDEYAESSESIDSDVRVVYAEDSSMSDDEDSIYEVPSEEGFYAASSDEESFDLQPGQMVTISGGRLCWEPEQSPAPQKKPIAYYTAEQLKNLRIRDNKNNNTDTKGIINPKSKFKKKKPVRKCANFDD